MKKVLVLAYDFPPLVSIGAQRPHSWYKYFPQFGCHITVVTRHWNKETHLPQDYVKPTTDKAIIENDAETNHIIIRAPFRPNLRDRMLLQFGHNRFTIIRKLLTVFYSFAEHLWSPLNSKGAIYTEADKFLHANKVDFIIATGEPFLLFKYASSLSAKHNTPWIADYRDGWTTNQGNYKLGFLSKLQRAFFKSREQKYITNVTHITTPAPEYAAALKQIHPNKEVSVIFNGYDEEVFGQVKSEKPRDDSFIISYAGSIYAHQNLEMFLQGLEKFMQQKDAGKPVEVNFYGLQSQPDAESRIMQNANLKNVVHSLPRLPYTEVVKKLKQSHLLLLLSAKDANWLNAKVFDYLATGRPIMLVENDRGVLEKLLTEMEGGHAFESADAVCKFLDDAYTRFNTGILKSAEPNERIKTYTRRNEAKRFCALLETL